jgi:pseudaminic acid synthase
MMVGGSKVFIVAELSANHRHRLDLALDTIKAMKAAGADAVKLQTYTPGTMTLDCANERFRIRGGTLWDGKTLYELYQEAMTPWEWHDGLKDAAERLGLVFFSTPFDKTATDFLAKLDVPLYKIASFEMTDIPLIEHVAAKGKPVLMSTGIATLPEIEEAISACRGAGNDQIALLKCTSAYPAPAAEANLLTIPDMARRFKCTIGISDHTLGSTVPVAAVALGARIIEKHFILDRELGGPDAAFSMEPDEFRDLVRAVRETESALGKASYELSDKTRGSRTFARSLFIARDVKKGEAVSDENVRSVRPAGGLAPKHLRTVLGKKFRSDHPLGTPLAFEQLE